MVILKSYEKHVFYPVCQSVKWDSFSFYSYDYFEDEIFYLFIFSFSSVAQLCPTLCDPWTVAHQASLSFTNSQTLFKLMSPQYYWINITF